MNAVLVNHYIDGYDSMGLHDELIPCMTEEFLVVSISFGAVREFTFQHKHQQQVKRLQLANGSCLIMWGKVIQTEYWHGLRKDPTCEASRWNLNFRKHKYITDL